FLARSVSYEMGIPAVALGALYSLDVWRNKPNVRIELRSPIQRIDIAKTSAEGVLVAGELRKADYYVSCLPPDRLRALAPALEVDTSWIEYSPITGIHIWFDRSVTSLPHATLLDRTIQW